MLQGQCSIFPAWVRVVVDVALQRVLKVLDQSHFESPTLGAEVVKWLQSHVIGHNLLTLTFVVPRTTLCTYSYSSKPYGTPCTAKIFEARAYIHRIVENAETGAALASFRCLNRKPRLTLPMFSVRYALHPLEEIWDTDYTRNPRRLRFSCLARSGSHHSVPNPSDGKFHRAFLHCFVYYFILIRCVIGLICGVGSVHARTHRH